MPNLDELFEVEAPHYEYSKSFEEARNDPFVSLHTSGSTGTPDVLQRVSPTLWELTRF